MERSLIAKLTVLCLLSQWRYHQSLSFMQYIFLRLRLIRDALRQSNSKSSAISHASEKARRRQWCTEHATGHSRSHLAYPSSMPQMYLCPNAADLVGAFFCTHSRKFWRAWNILDLTVPIGDCVIREISSTENPIWYASVTVTRCSSGSRAKAASSHSCRSASGRSASGVGAGYCSC
jgi:hypothetical protein